MFICVRFDTEDAVLKEYCKEYGIDYLKDKNINSEEFMTKIEKYKCDLFVSMSFNQIFKKEIINIPKYKIINCHAGKLPFYRGRNILNWVLINDEKEFGITAHYVDEGIDTGDIILQESHPITDKDDYSTLLLKAYSDCAEILYKAILLFKKGKVKGIQQKDIHPVGFYCSQRKNGDESISWNKTSREIFNFIRGICKPSPMARSIINGKEMLINKAHMVDNSPVYKDVVGSIVGKDENMFYVKTKDSCIKIIEYTFDGGIKIGDRFDLK